MAKPSVVFVCRECGGEALRWAGQCPHCRAWNTLEEFHPLPAARGGGTRARRAGSPPARPTALADIDLSQHDRLRLGWEELNRVLGGGVVPGSLVLLSGEPGVGKSTLLLHLASQAAAGGRTVLYASGEESAQQVGMRARRLEVASDHVLLLAETDLDAIAEALDRERPAIAIVDSIQTVQEPSVDGAPGSVTQVRQSTARLLRLAKETGVPIFLAGHVTKDGAIAGPRVLEHMVDTVLYMEGEREQDLRLLRATKNRFGSAEEIGIFSMGEEGLAEVADAGIALLGEGETVPGTAVLPALEGSRPLLVEVQSLVNKAALGLPRRSAAGIETNRLHLLIAVLDRRAGIFLGEHDVYFNVAGGLRVKEPALDLAAALSLASARLDVALPAGTVAFGEVSLSGQVRRVGRIERRLQEAQRRGFVRAVVPAGVRKSELQLELIEVPDVATAINRMLALPGRRPTIWEGPTGLPVDPRFRR
ncbi:MAG: DNA repair protein RadA [Candidatus Dormibacteraceae bacterium]